MVRFACFSHYSVDLAAIHSSVPTTLANFAAIVTSTARCRSGAEIDPALFFTDNVSRRI
jgi:hypothetical protein